MASTNAVEPNIPSAMPDNLTVHFFRFLSACYENIDAPLEATLARSIDMTQFVDTAQCRSFLPQHVQQVRGALWEYMRNAHVRILRVMEVERQNRLYGGILARSFSGSVAPHETPHPGEAVHCTSAPNPPTPVLTGANAVFSNRGRSNSSASPTALPTASATAPDASMGGMRAEDEAVFLAALRARGQFLPPAPRHALDCARRPPPPFQRPSRLREALDRAANTTTTTATATATANVYGNTGVVECSLLTPGCALCVAEGLLRSCWLALRLIQLLGLVAAAHLCAAPLVVPQEALSTTPREALCVGYHIAQEQLRVAVGILFTVAAHTTAAAGVPQEKTDPNHHIDHPLENSSNPCSNNDSSNPVQTDRCDYTDDVKAEMEAHDMESTLAITSLGYHALECSVQLSRALQRMQSNSLCPLLLHAMALAFCDRNGVYKARWLLREWCAAHTVKTPVTSDLSPLKPTRAAAAIATTTTPITAEGVICSTFKDMYDMWLPLDATDPTKLEGVAIGVLFTVFLQLLELRESPPPDLTAPIHVKIATVVPPATTHTAAGPTSGLATATSLCRDACEALDTIVLPRLLTLCDAADGAASARGRQSLALHWLLRGTLCRILNALTATLMGNLSEADVSGPMQCAKEAVQAAEAAREFLDHPLLPDWVNSLADPTAPRRASSEATTATTTWRLGVFTAPNVLASADSLEHVTEVALLPPAAMRMWFVLAPMIFRSASADLLAAQMEEENEETVWKMTESTEDGKSAVNAAGTGSAQSPSVGLGGVAADNAKRMAEVRRHFESSPLSFWYRWNSTTAGMTGASKTPTMATKAVAVNPHTGETTSDINTPPLLERYHQLLLLGGTSHTVASSSVATPTAFMCALQTMEPIAPDPREAFLCAKLIPQEVLSTPHAQPTLGMLDGRLQEAWRQYDLQCVRPLTAPDAKPGVTRDTTRKRKDIATATTTTTTATPNSSTTRTITSTAAAAAVQAQGKKKGVVGKPSVGGRSNGGTAATLVALPPLSQRASPKLQPPLPQRQRQR